MERRISAYRADLPKRLVGKRLASGVSRPLQGAENPEKWEPELGFEPRTCCLQDSCSSQLSYPGGIGGVRGRQLRRTVMVMSVGAGQVGGRVDRGGRETTACPSALSEPRRTGRRRGSWSGQAARGGSSPTHSGQCCHTATALRTAAQHMTLRSWRRQPTVWARSRSIESSRRRLPDSVSLRRP